MANQHVKEILNQPQQRSYVIYHVGYPNINVNIFRILTILRTRFKMTNETGPETARNYRYQYLYAALLAMQMYNRKNNFVEIICEYDNDITAKDQSGTLTSYQITRSDTIGAIPQSKVIQSMQQFLELCKDKNKRYNKFCLISNQKIYDIATKTDEVKFLSDKQIERYGIKLSIDKDHLEDHDCLGKMAFLVIQDSLSLEYLIQKEILTFDKHISHMKTNCIKERATML